jgi:HPt (histidine-containing phosphotransfer) domain-containing protein
LVESALDRGVLPEAWAGFNRLEQEANRSLASLRENREGRGDAPPLDPDRLAEYLRLEESMPGLLEELVAVFLRDAPNRITALEVAVATGDIKGARDAAHALKGAALQLGAMPLGRAAAEMEREANAGSLEKGPVLLQRIVVEWSRARPALEEHLTRPQPSEVA